MSSSSSAAAVAAASDAPNGAQPAPPPPLPAPRRRLRIVYAAHPSVAGRVRGGGGGGGGGGPGGSGGAGVRGVLLVDGPPVDVDGLVAALRHKLRLKKKKKKKSDEKKKHEAGKKAEGGNDVRLFVSDGARAGTSRAVAAEAELTPPSGGDVGGGADALLGNGCAVTVVAASAAAELLAESRGGGGGGGGSGADDDDDGDDEEAGRSSSVPLPPRIRVPRSLADDPVGAETVVGGNEDDTISSESGREEDAHEKLEGNGEEVTVASKLPPGPRLVGGDDDDECGRVGSRAARCRAAPSGLRRRLAPTPSVLRFSPSGRFPVLEGNVLPLLREATAAAAAPSSSPFVERNRGRFVSFDYRDAPPSAFPDPFERGGLGGRGGRIKPRDRWLLAARRECRGLLVSAETGEVLARRFHKFFNVGEVDEAAAGAVDAALASAAGGGWRNAVLTEKVDGSLVSPVLLPPPAAAAAAAPAAVGDREDDERPGPDPEPDLVWATRSSVDDGAVARFVASRRPSADYDGLARRFLSRGKTPLFEWCEAGRGGAVGVIRHERSSLTLLAVRDNVTGEYPPREEWEGAAGGEYGVPVVGRVDVAELVSAAAARDGGDNGASDDDVGGGGAAEDADVRALVRAVRSLGGGGGGGGGTEGVVLSLPDGRRFKIKTGWYVAMAAASRKGGGGGGAFLAEMLRRRPTLADVPPGRVWAACLGDGADDAVALCAGLLADRDDEGGAEEAAELRRFRRAAAEAAGRLRAAFRRWGEEVRRWRPEVPPRTKAAWAARRGGGGGGVRDDDGDGDGDGASSSSVGWSAATLVRYACGRDEEGGASLDSDLRRIAGLEDVGGGGGGGGGAEILADLLGVEWDARRPACRVRDEAATRRDGGAACQGGARTGDAAAAEIAREFADFELDRPRGKKLARQIKEHVSERYLPRKMADYLGRPAASVLDDTVVCVGRDYSPSEGKIRGMWERFRKDGVVDLRVDLQPRLAEATTHCGDAAWAMWAVQFGPSAVCRRSSRPRRGLASGTFAAVMVRTGTNFAFGELRRAVETSFDRSRIVKLTLPDLRGSEAPSHSDREVERSELGPSECDTDGKRLWRIFCDLDGVLADFDAGLAAISGKRPCDFPSRARMWQQIASHRNFFETLPWMEDGEDLWAFLSGDCAEASESPPAILTGLPDAKSGRKAAARQKRAWCSSKLGGGVEVIACRSADKWTYSAPGRILVDDLLEHKAAWERRGGVFVHHTAAARTIRALRGLMFPRSYASPEEQAAASELREAARETIKGNVPPHFTVDPKDIVQVSGSTNDELFSEAVEGGPRDVAIDVEWRPDELVRGGARSAASLLQVAIGQRVFLIDTKGASPRTLRAVIALFGNGEILKLFFGLEEDLLRLVAGLPAMSQGLTTVPGAVDLQACLQALVFPEEQDKLSLSSAAYGVIGRRMVKSKALQASDWARRPLTTEQLQYAACDAVVLLQMWRAICSYPCLLAAVSSSMIQELPLPSRVDLRPFKKQVASNEDSNITKPQQQALADLTSVLSIAPAGGVRAVHASLFLTAQSKHRLLEAYPPRNRVLVADHVTLMHSPHNVSDLAGFPVGRTCRVLLLEEVADELTQAIRVRVEDPLLEGFVSPGQELHVTVSTAANTPASRSNDLLKVHRNKRGGRDTHNDGTTEGHHILLDAVAGLKVSLDPQQSSLADLDSRLMKKLMDFAENGEPGSSIKFRGGELTGSERAAIHEFASDRGLESRSEGPKEKRVLILTQPKFASGGGFCEEMPSGRIVASAAELDDKKGKSRLDQNWRKFVGSSRIILSQDVFSAIELKGVWDGRNSAKIEGVAGGLANGLGGPEIIWDHDRNPLAGSPESILRSVFSPGEHHREGSDMGKHVFILRGVPGSGKSTLSSLLVQALGGADNVAVCAADRFFELGANVQHSQKPSCQGTATYLECFDENKLGEAHDYCRRCFLDALRCPRTQAIIVDNTNARRAEYQWYLKQEGVASAIVIEIVCESQEQLRTFQKRSVHQVPWQAAARIFANMEADKDAVLLQPHHELQQFSAVADGRGSLRQWLTEHHCFHNISSRPKSHLNMSPHQTETSHSMKRHAGAKFLNIPAALYDEFLDRYARDTSPWFLAEFATQPYFRLFFDFDVVLDDDELVNEMTVARKLQFCLASVGVPRHEVVVVGRGRSETCKGGKQKQCFHLHCPTVIVDAKDARLIQQTFVAILRNEAGTQDWENAVDEEVFVGDVSLRMHGSRKPGMEHEDGRLYHFIGQLDRNGELDFDATARYASNPTELLKATSIRARPGDRPTQGISFSNLRPL